MDSEEGQVLIKDLDTCEMMTVEELEMRTWQGRMMQGNRYFSHCLFGHTVASRPSSQGRFDTAPRGRAPSDTVMPRAPDIVISPPEHE